MKPRRTTTGVFVCQGDETLSRPHETLDFIVAGSMLVVEYFQLLNGNCFVACFIKETMHGKQGSKVWCSVRSWGYVFYVVNEHNLLVLGSPSRFSCQDLR